MALILPFRGYVPHKGVSYGRQNTAWNKKALAQIENFRNLLQELNPVTFGASYGSGSLVDDDHNWFEDIYFEEDMPRRSTLREISKYSERGSIVVLKLEDVYQDSEPDETFGTKVHISPLDRISERYIPVISVGDGATSLVRKLEMFLPGDTDADRERIRTTIFKNYDGNMRKIKGRISQLTKLESREERERRVEQIWNLIPTKY